MAFSIGLGLGWAVRQLREAVFVVEICLCEIRDLTYGLWRIWNLVRSHHEIKNHMRDRKDLLELSLKFHNLPLVEFAIGSDFCVVAFFCCYRSLHGHRPTPSYAR